MIDFKGTGEQYNSNWGSKFKNFKKIIKKMSQSNLRTSLETVNCSYCQFDTTGVVRGVLENYHMDHVSVSFDDTPPYEFEV